VTTEEEDRRSGGSIKQRRKPSIQQWLRRQHDASSVVTVVLRPSSVRIKIRADRTISRSLELVVRRRSPYSKSLQDAQIWKVSSTELHRGSKMCAVQGGSIRESRHGAQRYKKSSL
jgi:hypothetical protein